MTTHASTAGEREALRDALAAMVESYERDLYRSWERGVPNWSKSLDMARAALATTDSAARSPVQEAEAAPAQKVIAAINAGTAFTDGDAEAAYLAQSAHLNCPACGGSGHVDDTTPEVEGLTEHVAWMRYQEHNDSPTTVHVCDSDAPGAFKVYSRPAASPVPMASSAGEPVAEQALIEASNRGYDQGLADGKAIASAASLREQEELQELRIKAARYDWLRTRPGQIGATLWPHAPWTQESFEMSQDRFDLCIDKEIAQRLGREKGSTLAKQVASAQVEVAAWSPEKRASVQLEGTDPYMPKVDEPVFHLRSHGDVTEQQLLALTASKADAAQGKADLEAEYGHLTKPHNWKADERGSAEPLRWNISSGGYRFFRADGSEVNPHESPLYTEPPARDGSEPGLRPCGYMSTKVGLCVKCGQVHKDPIEATEQRDKPQGLTDGQLGEIARSGFDSYWTEACAGSDSEAWEACAKAVLAARASAGRADK